MIVSILIPVCSRNQSYTCFDDIPFIKCFFPSFLATKSPSIEYKIYIGYDDDDVFYNENIDNFKSITMNLIRLTGCQHAPAKAWNIMADEAYSTSDYLFQVGDDVIMETPGWTEHFISLLKNNNNIGVVGPCNKVNYDIRKRGNRPPVIENAFVSVKHYEIFGYLFHPSLKNWYCDDWLSRIYDPFLSEIQLNYTCRNTIINTRYTIEHPKNLGELITTGSQMIRQYIIEKSKKVFSYCVYGAQKKYCLGMVRNLEQITQIFPDFKVWIYLGNDVPQEYIDKYGTFSNVVLIRHDFTGGRMMSCRYFILENNFNFIFVRDADSRFGERDIWCIDNFLKSDYKIFTIRDHPRHGRELMGGQTGFKNTVIPNIRDLYYNTFVSPTLDVDKYQSDQNFIKKCIFDKCKQHVIAYSEYHNFGEGLSLKIPIPRKSDEDFCGNVYLFDNSDNEYVEFTIHGKK